MTTGWCSYLRMLVCIDSNLLPFLLPYWIICLIIVHISVQTVSRCVNGPCRYMSINNNDGNTVVVVAVPPWRLVFLKYFTINIVFLFHLLITFYVHNLGLIIIGCSYWSIKQFTFECNFEGNSCFEYNLFSSIF